jgi:DNA uptake protein ComE-like DNA-binding protein
MNILKTYFDFTKGERNAAFFLLLIVSFFSILPYFEQPIKYSKSDFSELMLMAKLDSIEKNTLLIIKQKPFNRKIKFIPFDPNTAIHQTFLDNGFSKYLAERIQKYRAAGGRFTYKSDLLKVYGIDSNLINQLWSCIKLPEKGQFSRAKESPYEKNYKSKKTQEIIELNSADTTQLISLPMIGSKLANRIILYRNKLGGFHSPIQLMEVYGLKPETFEIIKSRIQVNSDLIEKIDINKCTNEQLNKHPYFGYKISSQLINYRAQHGAFKSLNDLKNLVLLSQESIEKIKFYIKFV